MTPTGIEPLERARVAAERLPRADRLLGEAVALETRREKKVLVQSAAVPDVLEALAADHAVLLAGAEAIARYRSLYFDTAEDALYRDHQRGAQPRFKVRVREHVTRGVSSLEVKIRSTGGLTKKARRPREGLASLTPEERGWIAGQCPRAGHAVATHAALEPRLLVSFARVTLVTADGLLRTTIDLDLAFETRAGRVALPGLAIVEIKSLPEDRTRAREQKTRVRAATAEDGKGFSKYCIGRALLDVGLPVHRFRGQVRRAVLAGAPTRSLPTEFFAADDRSAASG